MTEARRLLEGMERIRDKAHEYRALPAEIERVANDELRKARAYLAWPMTSCEDREEHLTEEERELLEWHSPKSGWWMGEKRDDLCRGCSGRPIEDCVTRRVISSLSESRAREGELVAALQKYSTHGSGCLAEGWKRGDNEYRCDCGLDAALAAALGEKAPCPTCKGTRVAPIADEDLGGEGITMSSCPDCVYNA